MADPNPDTTLLQTLMQDNDSISSDSQHLLPDPESASQAPETPTTTNTNIGKVCYIGGCFFILFTAISGTKTLVAEIYDQLGYTGLGKINLMVFYVLFTIIAPFTPSIIKNWTSKNTMFMASLSYICPMAVGALTTSCQGDSDYVWCIHRPTVYIINIISSVINGFFAPMLWVASNRYIMGCTNDSNKGKYFGIFNGFVFGSNMSGSLVASFLIKPFGQLTYYIVCSGVTVVAIILFAVAPQISRYSKEASSDTIRDKMKKMLALASHKRMRPFLAYVLFAGILLAIYYSFEYEIIINAIPDLDANAQDAITAYIMTVEGIMTIFASLGGGKLADLIKRNRVLSIFNAFSVIAIITSLISYYNKSLVFAYIMASCWGIASSGGFAMMGIVIAKDFGGTLEGYALMQFVSHVAITVGLGFSLGVTNIPVFLYITTGFLIVTIVSTLLYRTKEEKIVPEESKAIN